MARVRSSVAVHHASSPRIRGTRNRSSSAAGAPGEHAPRAAATGGPRRRGTRSPAAAGATSAGCRRPRPPTPWPPPRGSRPAAAPGGPARPGVSSIRANRARSATSFGVKATGRHSSRSRACGSAVAAGGGDRLSILGPRPPDRPRLDFRAASQPSSGRSTAPVLSLGVKNVDFGGISRPSRAVRSISARLTGRTSTAASARPSATASSTGSSPCW